MAFTNVSDYSNYTDDYKSSDEYRTIVKLYKCRNGIWISISVVGTALNLWLLAAILSCPELRSRLRNKIICCSFVLHLVDCIICTPIVMTVFYHREFVHCVFVTIVYNIHIMQDIVANWLLVMLIAVFIAQIADFNPTARLSPRTVTFGTVGLLAFPWLAALVIVPIVIHEYHKLYPYFYDKCISVSYESLVVFKSIDTIMPIILAIVLVTAAAFMKYRRFTLLQSSGSIQFELMERGPEIDNILVYIIAVIVSVLCDLLMLLLYTGSVYIHRRSDFLIMVSLYVAAWILGESRALLIPLVWLIFPDIRHRLRAWRPWYRPAPGIDLTVKYQREEQ